MRVVVQGLVAAVLLVVAGSALGDVKIVPGRTPADATLDLVVDGWEVYTVRDEPGDPRKRAVSYRTRYFVQRSEGLDARIAHTMRGTHGKKVTTLLADGTLILSYVTTLTVAAPDGATTSEQLRIKDRHARVVAGYPDGLLLQPYDLNKAAHVYFVPFDGRRLRYGAAARVTGEPVPVNMPPRFLRGGDVVVWAGFRFDLRTQVRHALPVRGHPNAFDGTTLVQWTHLEGKNRLLITTLTSPPRTISQRVRNPDGHYAYPPFAVHGRVAYFVAFPRVPGSVAAEDIPPSRLMALDLSSEEGRAHLLLEIPGLRRPRGILNNVPRWPHRIAKKGLWFWLDKDTWTLVPWLKSWPNED